MGTKITETVSTQMNPTVDLLQDSKKQKAETSFYTFLDSATKANTKVQQKQDSGSDKKETNVTATDETDKDRVQDKQGQVKNVQTKEEAVQDDSGKVSEEASYEATEPVKDVENLLGFIAQQLGISKEELLANYTELQTNIKSILTEKLGVSEEELMSAMENLSLTVMDVLEPSKLMQLVVSMDENLDASDILTDENLYAQVKEITEALDTVCADLPQKQIEQLEQLNQVVKTLQESDVGIQASQFIQKEHVWVKAQDISAQSLEEQNQLPIQNEPIVKVVDDNKSDTGLKKDTTGNEGFHNFVNQLVNTVSKAGSVEAAGVFANQVDAESVVRQLTDQIKIQVKADTTSMEMQLYPESYGKLNLHVAVKDGVVTAQLAVENEAVKRALESQVIQLRENINQQGLKVEAIEVTVESHQFEQNLQQNQNQEAFEQESKTRKNINLNQEMNEGVEAAGISEEEELIRKIMIQNGNRINYSA